MDEDQTNGNDEDHQSEQQLNYEGKFNLSKVVFVICKLEVYVVYVL